MTTHSPRHEHVGGSALAAQSVTATRSAAHGQRHDDAPSSYTQRDGVQAPDKRVAADAGTGAAIFDQGLILRCIRRARSVFIMREIMSESIIHLGFV
ncbi:hypothetical protein OHA21_16160 [Actinoplanes sp. NBC_00393]|uniref:hypothetical protein n=1 Tax=Actinoplanes sp. NBC_00393 TaxID=2975953 RepID=UPI002E21E878